MPARTGSKSDRKTAHIGKEVNNAAASPMGQSERDRLRGALSVRRTAPTLRMLALGKLRAAIIDGELAPNTRLVERQLCDLLGVSRTIVREILRQLEAGS
jgi:DNA-binding GntR family transcriptional regulator